MSAPTTPAQTAASSVSSDYRFDHPRIQDVLNDMYIPDGEPGPGDKLEPFQLQATDGGWLRSSDLPALGKPLLLVFGSRTCPVTESAAAGLKELHARYGSHLRFVMVQ